MQETLAYAEFLLVLFKNVPYNLKITERQECLCCDMPVWKSLAIIICENFAKVHAVQMSQFVATIVEGFGL